MKNNALLAAFIDAGVDPMLNRKAVTFITDDEIEEAKLCVHNSEVFTSAMARLERMDSENVTLEEFKHIYASSDVTAIYSDSPTTQLAAEQRTDFLRWAQEEHVAIAEWVASVRGKDYEGPGPMRCAASKRYELFQIGFNNGDYLDLIGITNMLRWCLKLTEAAEERNTTRHYYLPVNAPKHVGSKENGTGKMFNTLAVPDKVMQSARDLVRNYEEYIALGVIHLNADFSAFSLTDPKVDQRFYCQLLTDEFGHSIIQMGRCRIILKR